MAAALQQALGAQVQAIAAEFLSRKAQLSQMPPLVVHLHYLLTVHPAPNTSKNSVFGGCILGLHTL